MFLPMSASMHRLLRRVGVRWKLVLLMLPPLLAGLLVLGVLWRDRQAALQAARAEVGAARVTEALADVVVQLHEEGHAAAALVGALPAPEPHVPEPSVEGGAPPAREKPPSVAPEAPPSSTTPPSSLAVDDARAALEAAAHTADERFVALMSHRETLAPAAREALEALRELLLARPRASAIMAAGDPLQALAGYDEAARASLDLMGALDAHELLVLLGVLTADAGARVSLVEAGRGARTVDAALDVHQAHAAEEAATVEQLRRFASPEVRAQLLALERDEAFARPAAQIMALAMARARGEASGLSLDAWRDALAARRGAVVSQLRARLEARRATYAAAEADASRARTVLALLAGLGLLVVVGLGAIVIREIHRPLAELSRAASRVAVGDLGPTLDVDGQDELAELARALQGVVDYLSDVQRATVAVSHGDLSTVLTPRSDADELSRSVMRMSGEIRKLLDEVTTLSAAAARGQLGGRLGVDTFEGAYRDVASGVNAMLWALLSPIEAATTSLERIAARDLSAEVVGEFKGDHARLKNAVNTA